MRSIKKMFIIMFNVLMIANYREKKTFQKKIPSFMSKWTVRDI